MMKKSPFRADNSPESPSAILLFEILTFFPGSVHVTTRSLKLLGGVMYLNMRGVELNTKCKSVFEMLNI